MLVKHLTIKNKQIHIENQDVDFSEYGVYLLKGDNGSGKTSVIKKIIFGNVDVDFSEEYQRKSYENERYKLISYLPQTIISYRCKVRDFISKCRTDVSDNEMIECLKRLHAENIKLDMEFNTLSGGERVKVALASVVLKDTPYLFLDEPTNNVDNETVKRISDFLFEYGKNHTVVIVSHDTRIQLEKYKTVYIEDNVIIEENIKQDQKNEKKCRDLKINWIKLFLKLAASKMRFLSAFVIMICFITAVILNVLNMELRVSTDLLEIEGVIATYKAELVYGELNRIYVENKNLQIAESDYYTMITYDDLPEIMSLDGVERAILLDTAYYSAVVEKLMEGTLLEQLTLISQPNVITEYFYHLGGYGESEALLLNGTYPKDEADEVAVSKSVLKKFFAFTDEMLDEAIGQMIEINGKEYKIVGIMDFDGCLLSYESGQDYGYYEYDESTYAKYADKIKGYLTETEYYLPNETDTLYLFTDKNYEEVILDYLMQTYPADNYLSGTYNEVWVEAFNAPVIRMFVMVNFGVFLLVSMLIFALNKKTIALQMNKIRDYENYYIKNGKMRMFFVSSYIAEALCIAGILSLTIILFPEFSNLLYPILLMGVLVIYVPIIMYASKVGFNQIN